MPHLKEGTKRGETTDYQGQESSGTSIFDPVLCELIYRWFCPPNGLILDPFAGGSVRGIVAAKLGRSYIGIELRLEQIDANNQQADRILNGNEHAQWIHGDARKCKEIAPGDYDLIFTCPPYGDLEIYSDHPADLSTMPFEQFIAIYREIIAASCLMLKPDRFAAICVGDYRDKKGFYRNFVSETIAAFQNAGLRLYNEAVLITAVGSLPIRISKQFENARKLGKTHQNVLVFCKGDPRKAAADIGPVEVEWPEGMGSEEATDS